MKNIAYILAFIFTSFIATPSIVAYIDSAVDISFAYDVNEEESSKNQLTIEYDIKELHSNYRSIEFLKEQEGHGHYYSNNYRPVCLDVTSPPPKRA
ncbi:hypothetical protein [Salegentibacter chungangensis]|uniref:Uncharacterized protein n=1 Tax=Salegentibacter chungangensis TaxID=1335724 RepID=A0ABW3NPJ3_9FLAO